MDSVYLYDKYGAPISHDLWPTSSGSSTGSADTGSEPDEGIWEVRGGRQEFLYSRVMCWVASTAPSASPTQALVPGPPRALARDARRDLPGHLSRTSGTRSGRRSSSTRASTTLDASTLLMPLVKFIGSDRPALALHPRARSSESLVEDSLVYPLPHRRRRLRRAHGRRRARSTCAPSGTSSALSRAGRRPARRGSCSRRCSATRTTSASTPRSSGPHGEHLGNFPQAFTHLGADQRRLRPRPQALRLRLGGVARARRPTGGVSRMSRTREERRRVGAVDGAVVEAQAEHPDGVHDDCVAAAVELDDHRAALDPVGRQDRDLRLVDDRRRDRRARRARVRDRERPAGDVVGESRFARAPRGEVG